jgi:hypothetical protein
LGVDVVIVYQLFQLFVLVDVLNDFHGVFASWAVYQQRHLICREYF